MPIIRPCLRPALAFFLAAAAGFTCAAETIPVAPLTRAVVAVGPRGAGHREAMAACAKLAQAEAAQVPDILAAMDGAGPLAVNWLRAVIETIAQRAGEQGRPLPVAALERVLGDHARAPAARRIAYELLLRVTPDAQPRLAAGLLDDPHRELRRDAVALVMANAQTALTADRKPEATAAYRRALSAARDLDQINEAAQRLRSLGETVNLPHHFGFIVRWDLIAPFDNRHDCGYDAAYGPEQDREPAAESPGKDGPVRWTTQTTTDEYGTVDLNKALGKFKGAIAYARTEFWADSERAAEFRLGCSGATLDFEARDPEGLRLERAVCDGRYHHH